MLAVMPVLDRVDGDVFAAGLVIVRTFLDSDAGDDEDFGNADETFAEALIPEKTASDDSGSANAKLTVRAELSNPPFEFVPHRKPLQRTSFFRSVAAAFDGHGESYAAVLHEFRGV